MATLDTMRSRLSLILAGHLNTDQLNKLINRVHQEEVEGYEWQRLKTSSVLAVKAPKTAGTVAVTQDSTTVTGTGTAWTASDVGSYIRVAGEFTPVRVSAVVSSTSLTLATAWARAASSELSYTLFPRYYTLATGTQTLLALRGQREVYEKTTWELDQMDPDRSETADEACYWAPFDYVEQTNALRIELWPIPAIARLYTIETRQGHVDLTATMDRPLVPASVIENKALRDGYLFMFAKTGDVKWHTLAQAAEKRYFTELEEARIQDVNRSGIISQVQDVYRGGYSYEYAITHDVS